jgi:hypothetical protein
MAGIESEPNMVLTPGEQAQLLSALGLSYLQVGDEIVDVEVLDEDEGWDLDEYFDDEEF